jgi:hypothetical protein
MELLELILAFGMEWLFLPWAPWAGTETPNERRLGRRLIGGAWGAVVGLVVAAWVGGPPRIPWGMLNGAIGGILAVVLVDYLRRRRPASPSA